VQVDRPVTIASLDISGIWLNKLTLNATLTLTGASEWDSGTIDPLQTAGTLINDGTLTLNGSGNVYLGGGGTLQNNGAIIQTGTGNLGLASGGNVATTLVNAATATYDFRNDSSILYWSGAGGLVQSAGLIEKTGGTGTSAVGVPLINSGTLNTLYAGTGTLGLDADSTNTNGTFEAATGARLDLTNDSSATFTETGTFTATGAGLITLENGALAIGTAGATFNIPQTVAFQWSGGSISVPFNATLAYNGTLTLNGSGNVHLGGGGTLQNNGTINQTGTGNMAFTTSGNVATTLVNAATATYDLQNDSGFYSNGSGGVVHNAGLIEKTGSTGTSVLSVPLTNTGTLDAASGVLQLAGNSTNTNGTYLAAAGATLDLTGGSTFSQTGTFTGGGAGIVTLGGGTLSIYSSSATFNIPSTLTFYWSGGTVNVPVNDTLTYSGAITFTGSSNEYLDGGGTFTEKGTITQAGTGHLQIDGTSTNATTLNIPAGSAYQFQTDSGIVQGGGTGGVVNNAGTISKTAGLGTSVISTAFNNNSATLSVQSGTLALATAGGVSNGGKFTVASGAILDLTGGKQVRYAGTFTGSGAGQVQLTSGTLYVAGGSNGAIFNLPKGLFRWSGGTLDTAGSNFTIPAGGVVLINGVGTEDLDGGGTLTLGGTVMHTGIGSLRFDNGTTLNILATGLYDLQSNAGLLDGYGDGGAVSNAGLLRKTGGTGSSAVSTFVSTTGRVEVHTGTLKFSGTVDQVSDKSLTGASWSVFGSSTVQATLTITLAGTLTDIGLGASVTLNGPHTAFTNLGGLATIEGSFSLLGGQSFTTSGDLTCSGGLTLSAGSALTVGGSFTLTSDGTLNLQMGGTSASPLIGSITTGSGGTVTLNGQLAVTGPSSVKPAVGTTFEILNNQGTAAVGGVFAGLPEGATFTLNGMTFKISYVGGTGNDVIITRTA
jgi:hypothetical protein